MKVNANAKIKMKEKEKKKKKQWITQRVNMLMRVYNHTKATAVKYTYIMERVMKTLKDKNIVVQIKLITPEGWYKTIQVMITLQGQERLQRQSRKKDTITAIKVETGKRIIVPVKCLIRSKG